ncbi:uncharacterized protein PAC_07576 [Phialocephala subalpina]|uniref:Heterokaryon incompatibility domain-containing protein n=1 Tax=Phialocephala subalpina TaxID=576137 RepID=A0A1L7WY40_9HELO|nr:uncharacterized protein PAC_07576 [Phialocephala subalpina]
MRGSAQYQRHETIWDTEVQPTKVDFEPRYPGYATPGEKAMSRKLAYLTLLLMDPTKILMNHADIEVSTESEQSWSCVRTWLKNCTKSHHLCSMHRDPSWRPTRLLDLGPLRAVLPPHLVEYDEIPIGVVYATLSHCFRANWTDEGPVDLYSAEPTGWTRAFRKEPLNRRGWVVQERLLSPRICHFTGTQLIWECSEAFACERYPLGSGNGNASVSGLKSLSKLSTSHQPDEEECFYSRYRQAGRDIRNCSENTKLLASRLCRRDVEDGLEYQLVWVVDQTDGRLRRRAATYIAPTWSWASVNGAAVHLSTSVRTRARVDLLSKFLELDVVPTHSSTLCTDGYLNLRCFLAPVTLDLIHARQEMKVIKFSNGIPATHEQLRFYTALDVPNTDTEGISFWCPPILCRQHFRSASHNPIATWKAALPLKLFGVELCDEVLQYRMGSDGEGYKLSDAVPQFNITIK